MNVHLQVPCMDMSIGLGKSVLKAKMQRVSLLISTKSQQTAGTIVTLQKPRSSRGFSLSGLMLAYMPRKKVRHCL